MSGRVYCCYLKTFKQKMSSLYVQVSLWLLFFSSRVGDMRSWGICKISLNAFLSCLWTETNRLDKYNSVEVKFVFKNFIFHGEWCKARFFVQICFLNKFTHFTVFETKNCEKAYKNSSGKLTCKLLLMAMLKQPVLQIFHIM